MRDPVCMSSLLRKYFFSFFNQKINQDYLRLSQAKRDKFYDLCINWVETLINENKRKIIYEIGNIKLSQTGVE